MIYSATRYNAPTDNRKIIGLIIGILVLGTRIYYLAKEQHDPESKKIYTVISVIGGIITAVCTGMLWLF